MDKRDKINLIALISIALLSILLLLGTDSLFGSNLDWRTQHYAIPEYFRTLFYSDFNLLPSFAFNLGAGQNIYNFSYYGLLSPIILISYLLPFVKMATYIQVTSILLYLSSIVLFYKWIRTRFDQNDSFFLSLLFMFATPLLFHSHRHIMFVGYMSFLIMSLMGVDRFYKEKKSLLLIVSSFLLIMTNYFFAVSSLFAIGFYAIYVQIEKGNKFSDVVKETFKVVVPLLISVLMASIILMPTAYTLVSGRAEANVIISAARLLTPQIHGMYMMYTPYSLGLTTIIFLAIIASFFKKDKSTTFLAIIFMMFSTFPIFIYILNGGMYLNAKVLIPFLPLAILLIGKTIGNLFINRKQTITITIIYILIMIPTFISLIPAYEQYGYFDMISVTALLIMLCIFQSKHIFKFGMVIVSLFIFLNINNSDNLVARDDFKKLNQSDKQTEKYKLTESNIYRVGDYINVFDNLNRINNIDQYKTTMYSSVSNGNYNNFFYNVFTNEVSFRNSAITAQGNNIMFNTFMGVKYLMSEKGVSLYEKIDENLYQNNNVLPLGYVNTNLMSSKFFDELKFPYTNEALINYVVVDEEVETDYKTNIEKITPEYTIEKRTNLTVKESKNGLKIDAKKNASLVLELEEALQDKVLFVKLDMDFNESCSVGDNAITINGVINQLTCSSWKYHNRNYTFEYVISSVSDIKELNIEFAKGHYEISHLELFVMDEKLLENTNDDLSEFVFNKNKTKGDNIVGQIDVKENGYFVLSIPFDKGFTILVDGKEVNYEMVDKAFIGFKMNKGHHLIEINYTAPYLKEGIIVSTIGLIGFICYIYMEKRRLKNEKNIISSSLL